jgi:hypothetical protein
MRTPMGDGVWPMTGQRALCLAAGGQPAAISPYESANHAQTH